MWAIEKRREKRQRRDTTILGYARAGHAVGAIAPNIPTATTICSQYGRLDFGDSRTADASARADSWPKLLHFLAQARRH